MGITAASLENYEKSIDTLSMQNGEMLTVKAGGIPTNHCALKK
jgi:hypothetical protein